MDNDLVYLNRRAGEERVAALNCDHSGARGIHLEMAQAYEFRVFLLKELEAPKSIPTQHAAAELRSFEECPPDSAGAYAGYPVDAVDPPMKTFVI